MLYLLTDQDKYLFSELFPLIFTKADVKCLKSKLETMEIGKRSAYLLERKAMLERWREVSQKPRVSLPFAHTITRIQ